jgi:hypothetical protein
MGCVCGVCAREHRVRRTEAGSAAATLRILNVVAKPGSDWYAMASGREARMVWTLSGNPDEDKRRIEHMSVNRIVRCFQK